MVSAVTVNQVTQHDRVKRDGVKVKLLEVTRWRLADDGAAIRPRAMRVVHARPIVRQVATGMSQEYFQPRVALHHAIKNQMTDSDGGVEWIADDIVQIVLCQPFRRGEAIGVHEKRHAQLVHLAKELLQTQRWICQVLAVDMGVDLNAAQTKLFDGALQFNHGHVGVLQRHRANTDKAVWPLAGQMRDAVIDITCQLSAKGRFGEVVVLKGCGRDGLNIDAHVVHVGQPNGDVRQLRCPVTHLFGVDITRQLVGKDEGHLLLTRVEHGGLLAHFRIEVMAMHVDAQLLLAFTGRFLDRHREFLGSGGFGGCSGVLVQRVGAAGLAGVKHRFGSLGWVIQL